MNKYKLKVNGVLLEGEFHMDLWCDDVLAYVDYEAGRIYTLQKDHDPDQSFVEIESEVTGSVLFHPERKESSIVCYGDESKYESWDDVFFSNDDGYWEMRPEFIQEYPKGLYRMVSCTEHSGRMYKESGVGYECRWDTSRDVAIWITCKWLRDKLKETVDYLRFIKLDKDEFNEYEISLFSGGKRLCDTPRRRCISVCYIVLIAKKLVTEAADKYKLDEVYHSDEEVYRVYTQDQFEYTCNCISDDSPGESFIISEFDACTGKHLEDTWTGMYYNSMRANELALLLSDHKYLPENTVSYSSARLVLDTDVTYIEGNDHEVEASNGSSGVITMELKDYSGTDPNVTEITPGNAKHEVGEGATLCLQSGEAKVQYYINRGEYDFTGMLSTLHMLAEKDGANRVLALYHAYCSANKVMGVDFTTSHISAFEVWYESLYIINMDVADDLFDLLFTDDALNSKVRNILPVGITFVKEVKPYLDRARIVDALCEKVKHVSMGGYTYGYIES